MFVNPRVYKDNDLDTFAPPVGMLKPKEFKLKLVLWVLNDLYLLWSYRKFEPLAKLEGYVAQALTFPVKNLLPTDIARKICKLRGKIHKAISVARDVNLIVGLVCSLFELITGTAFQMSKESSSDENMKDMSGVTFRMMSAKPYLKSFLEDQNRTSDFKEFYNYVAVPFQKIIQKVEDNKPMPNLMKMLATEGIALESALMSITNTPLIKHHYDFLNGLVEKSKILLHKKTEEHKQMLRAEIAPTYSSMALDKIQNKVTY